jgi:hypothetical protein
MQLRDRFTRAARFAAVLVSGTVVVAAFGWPVAAQPTHVPGAAISGQVGPAAMQVPSTLQDNTINGVPLCADHDPTKYHGLVERDVDGSIKCTYGHEHHDDPAALNAALGEPGSFFGLPGQAISYPWHTANPTTGVSENALFADGGKHEGYKWLVRQNLQPAGLSIYLKSFRAEEHILGVIDYPTQFHSFLFEGQICRVSDGVCGTLHMGGLHNAGNRLGTTPAGDLCVMPDGDASDGVKACSKGQFVNGTGSSASNARIMAPLPDAPFRNMTWYVDHNGGFQRSDVPAVTFMPGMGTGVWGPINPENPTDHSQRFDPHYVLPGVVDDFHHATSIGTDAMSFSMVGFPQDSQHLVSFTGWTDRHGNINPDCTSTGGLDCVPIVLDGVPVPPDGRLTIGYDDTQPAFGGGDQRTDHDVIVYRADGTTVGDLVTYPN